jgi:hypothetical protein
MIEWLENEPDRNSIRREAPMYPPISIEIEPHGFVPGLVVVLTI